MGGPPMGGCGDWGPPGGCGDMGPMGGGGGTIDTVTANLRTNLMDFRGFDSSTILILRGGILRAHREFPGKLESSNVSKDNVSREIGRTLN